VARVRRDGRTTSQEPNEGEPLGRLDWKSVRDLVGMEAGVIIYETGREVLSVVRDSVSVELDEIKAKLGRLPPNVLRDDIARNSCVP